MLVLSRKPNETLHIGDEIQIVVVAIHEGRVTLGIEAPSQYTILRGETVARILAQAEPPVPRVRQP